MRAGSCCCNGTTSGYTGLLAQGIHGPRLRSSKHGARRTQARRVSAIDARSRLAPFKRVAATIRQYARGYLGLHHLRPLEARNGKARTTTRRSHGFPSAVGVSLTQALLFRHSSSCAPLARLNHETSRGAGIFTIRALPRVILGTSPSATAMHFPGISVT